MINVVSCENMRKSDANTIENGTSGIELMWRAAMGIYNSVSWHGRVGIACGGGNNAGDGYALALILAQNGIDTELILLGDKRSPDGDYYYKKCLDVSIKSCLYGEKPLDEYDIIVDCIFGTGFVGAPRGVAREAIEEINKSGAYVVSADINSGLNADNGMCDIAVKSDITVSIGTLKSGHFLGRAKDFIGEIKNVDIGIDILDKPYHLIEAEDISCVFPKRNNFSNKGTYGYTTLIGGCNEYSGAIKLANLALCALKAGAGVSRLAIARSISHSVMPYILESTIYELDDENGAIKFNKDQIDEALRGARSVAIGMGIGSVAQTYEIISYVLKNYEIPIIIDADGLNALAKGDMSILKDTRCTVILTPHLKEFERLSKNKIESVLESPVELAKKFALEYGVILLLKGASTIVTDGTEVHIVDRGCAGMATAGSGDVLSGILAGICAQSGENHTLNACAGAFINGLAGEMAQSEVGSVSMLSSDTISKIPSAIKKIVP